jgi:Ca2+-binding RTX toxin-like protein
VSGAGSAQLYGDAGNDTIALFSYTGASTVFGGMGEDHIDASPSTANDVLSGDLGNDAITLGVRGDTIHGGAGSDTIQASSSGATYIHTGLSDSSATSATDSSELESWHLLLVPSEPRRRRAIRRLELSLENLGRIAAERAA